MTEALFLCDLEFSGRGKYKLVNRISKTFY